MTDTPTGLGEHIGQLILRKYGPVEIPVDLHELAQLCGVAEIREREMVEDGRIVWEGEDAIVELGPRKGRSALARQRFTLAHELGHAALASRSIVPPYLINAQSLSAGAEEVLCDRIAAALLMPRQWVLERLNRPVNLSRLALWAERAQVSVSAVAARLTEVLGTTCYLLRFRRAQQRWVLESRSGVPRELVGRTILGDCLTRHLEPLRTGDRWLSGHIAIHDQPYAVTAHIGMRKHFCLVLLVEIDGTLGAPLSDFGCLVGKRMHQKTLKPAGFIGDSASNPRPRLNANALPSQRDNPTICIT